MNQDLAEITVLQALSYLLEDEDKINRLCMETGMDLSDLRTIDGNPQIQAGILDFLLGHEEWLVEFCEINKISPDTPMRIRRFFPGGAEEFYVP